MKNCNLPFFVFQLIKYIKSCLFLSWLVKHKIKLQFFVTRFVYNMIWTAFILMGAYCIKATETTFLIKRSTRSSKTEKRDYHEFKIFFVFSLWKNLYGQIKDVFDLIIITIIAFQDLHTNEDWLVAEARMYLHTFLPSIILSFP